MFFVYLLVFYQECSQCYSRLNMTDDITLQEIRRKNLMLLVGAYEKNIDFCEAAGISVGFLPQLKKTKGIGEKLARKMERNLNLDPHSMDIDPDRDHGKDIVKSAKRARADKLLDSFIEGDFDIVVPFLESIAARK